MSEQQKWYVNLYGSNQGRVYVGPLGHTSGVAEVHTLLGEDVALKLAQMIVDSVNDAPALRAENQRLKEALQGMLKLVDDGLLVRNTANDNMTGWGILALPIVRAVQRANEALQPKEPKHD